MSAKTVELPSKRNLQITDAEARLSLPSVPDYIRLLANVGMEGLPLVGG